MDKAMRKALIADGEKLKSLTGEDHGPHFYDDDYDDGSCPNCGGEGVLYDCIDGCCVDAESGCELCEYSCDWCQPRKLPKAGGA